MQTSNSSLAKLLREVAAAYTIKKTGNIFEIRAYENAADSIEHSTSEVKDLWEEGKLGEIPGLGQKMQSYLDELFKTGKVKYFEEVKKGLKPIFFELLDITGIGPKTAQKMVKLGIKNLAGLKNKIKLRSSRMLLPYAFAQAQRILDYLKKSKDILEAHSLGSLRRMVATIGDLDFSASSKNPQKVVDYFCQMPGIDR